MKPIAVFVPTLRRPESLARALRSVFRQHDGADLIAQIVVVDNSPEGSARATIDALTSQSPAPLIYVHEPRPGVATARNAGLTVVCADHVTFLDDDEEAPQGWLAALFATHTRTGADVTFGPVKGVAPDAPPQARAYLERFFSRLGPATSGLMDETYGCGNSIMVRATALEGREPFDAAADETGGEDDRLFTRLKAQGARFAWAADAYVYEHAPAHRARLSYALKRALGYGQSPSQICARRGDWIGVVRWMVIGAGQALVYGGGALALWLARNPARYDFADRAARGVGKVAWPDFLRFYGAVEAERSSGLAPPSGGGHALGMESRTVMAVNSSQMKSL